MPEFEHSHRCMYNVLKRSKGESREVKRSSKKSILLDNFLSTGGILYRHLCPATQILVQPLFPSINRVLDTGIRQPALRDPQSENL